MKKLALTIALAGMAAWSYGQGYVTVAGTMQNQTNTTLLTQSWAGGTNLTSSGAVGALTSSSLGGAYDVALLALTGTENMSLYGQSALTSNWGFTGLQGTGTTFAGRLSIGTDIATTSFAPIGTSTTFILLGWSANLGTLAQVETELANGAISWNSSNGSPGYVGWTAAGTGIPGATPPANALTIQGASGSIIPVGMTMLQVPVPEPTTLALAGLGGISMLFLRRRKS